MAVELHGEARVLRWRPVPDYGGLGVGVYRGRDTLPSTSVYHYLRWDYAEKALRSCRLRLGRPEGWPDPHEKWWCDALFKGNGNLQDVSAFAMCWTTSHLDEAFWRIAALSSAGVPVVRLRSTVGRLEASAVAALQERRGKAFVGRVEYPELSVLKDLCGAIRSGRAKQLSTLAATALTTKRRAFRFENEVRLLWVERDTRDEFVLLPFEPLKCIRQIMIGPLVKPDDANLITATLKELGFGTEAIERSTIYEPPSV